jgi:hypothetical protein
MKLFETTNRIEIHVGTKTVCTSWNGGQAILGLHSYDGTSYIPPVNMTAHNAPTQWTMNNTAYAFVSSCPSQSICGVILPVTFKNLYGQYISGTNKLWWETAVEENTKEFIVERSLDASSFETVNVTDAVGKSNLYTFNDNSFKRGYINYYRVTAVDHNGARTNTSIYPIVNTDDKVVINAVYPNPANDKLSVSMSGRTAVETCKFTIYDMFGKKMMQKEGKVNFGSNNAFDLDIQSLPTGMYIIEISDSDNSLVSKQKFSKN